MCVILVCPKDVRPSSSVLYACHDANPHGAGVAWRENGKVRWVKNLGPGKLHTQFKTYRKEAERLCAKFDHDYPSANL